MRSNCVIQTSSDALGRLCVRDYDLSWVFPYVYYFKVHLSSRGQKSVITKTRLFKYIEKFTPKT